MDYDLKITGGTIVDGTGRARTRGDVAIAGGRIAAVGEAKGSARETIDAEGRVVAPGFVDIHTHYDAQVMWDPMLTISPWHGVTSVVMGNCGFGVAPAKPENRRLLLRTLENVEGMSLEALEEGLAAWPFETFAEYLDAIERRGTAINLGAMIGHSAVRLHVMGIESTERTATDDEIVAMARIVGDAAKAGALGFSTSTSPLHVGFDGRPVPSRLAEVATETVRLAGALRAAGGGTVQVTNGFEPAFDLFEAFAAASGGRVSWTALLTRIGQREAHMRHHEASLAQHRKGLPIFPQVSCRPLMMEMQMAAPFPFERLDEFRPASAADRAGKARVYADPAFRAALRHALSPAGSQAPHISNFRIAFAGMRVADCAEEPALNGRLVADIATERGAHPLDVVLDLALASNLATRFLFPLANTDEEGIELFLNSPNTVMGLSDAGAHASQLCDACFATDLLGRWVREKKALTLEAAVRHLSARPAAAFGLADRGVLAPGMAGDVVVFDPDTVAAGRLERVHDFPAGADRLISRATGIEAVIVNGTVIRQGGEDRVDAKGPLPGTVLRSTRQAARSAAS